MIKFKILSKTSGTSKTSGRPWYRVYLRADESGDSAIKDFFVSESVWNDMAKNGVSVDDYVYVTCALDAKLRFVIEIIERAE